MKTGTIIALGVIIAALAGAIFFISGLQGPDSSPYPQNETEYVFNGETDDILGFRLTNTSGTFAFTKEDGNFKLTDTDYTDESKWPALEFEQTAITSSLYSFTSMAAESTPERMPEAEELYGVAEPKATLTLTLADGDRVFYLGNAASVSSQYYLLHNDRLYTVSSGVSRAMESKLNDFRSKKLAEIQTDDLADITLRNVHNTLINFHLLGEGETGPVTAGSISAWLMTEPVRRAADAEKLNTYLFTVFNSLSADAVVSDGNPADYGITPDSPFVTLKKKDGTELTLYAGDRDEDSVYAAVAGGDVVYSLAKSKFDFINQNAYNYIVNYVQLVNIDNVNSVTVTDGQGFTKVLEIRRPSENEEEHQYFIDGAEVPKSEFSPPYQGVIGIKADGLLDPAEFDRTAAQPGDTKLTCAFNLTDGTVLETRFVAYDDRNLAVVENGGCDFYVRKTKIDDLFEQLSGL